MKNARAVRSFPSFKVILLSLMLSGCTVTPRYESPEMPLPNEWHTPRSAGMTDENVDCFLWWESLQDSTLTALMQRASENNVDLSIAQSGILQARLMRKGQEAALYPHVDASLTGGNLYCSKDMLKQAVCGKGTSHKNNIPFFEIGFDADWEIDLFGFHTHQRNAAEAKVGAAEANLHDVWISLSAEVARNYLELRGFQQKRHLLEQNIQTLRDTLHLTEELLKIGAVSQIHVAQAEQQLHQLKGEEPLLNLSIDRAIHRLSVLCGSPPGELFCELTPCQDLPRVPCEKPLGLPSELLRRRPDIRKAERDLAAATEDVGSAVAALYPRFSLSGFVGEIGTHLSAMTNGHGVTWFAAPQLLFPIFNSRLLKQDVEFNQILANQALCQYQKTVLAALEEVENGMASFRHLLEQEHHLDQTLHFNTQIYLLHLDLYEKGFKDYLEVLSSKQLMIESKTAYLEGQIHLLLNYVSLYKALGGGWTP